MIGADADQENMCWDAPTSRRRKVTEYCTASQSMTDFLMSHACLCNIFSAAQIESEMFNVVKTWKDWTQGYPQC